MSDKILGYIKNIIEKNGFNFFIIIGFLGILLLSYDEIIPVNKPKEAISFSMERYKRDTEAAITQLLSDVHGAGQVKVMVTFESGQENIYAWQEKTTQDVQNASADISGRQTDRYTYENEIVLVDNGNEKIALVEKTMQPAVQGVVVVCEGADDIKVISDITNAVSVALDITSNRICVIKMK